MKLFSLFLSFLCALLFALPSSRALAQSANIQKALETVKERVDDLVNAKDTNSPQELALRIETYNKVLDFSIAEAKDLKLKLLSIETEEVTLGAWRDAMMEIVSKALKRFDEEKQTIEIADRVKTVEDVKQLAQQFKEWREENYLPAANQIKEYFLIEQETLAIKTAEKRSQKIELDMVKLQKQKIKGINEVVKLLGEANRLIQAANEKNREAAALFSRTYLAPFVPPSPPAELPSEKNDQSLNVTALPNPPAPLASSADASSTPQEIAGNAGEELPPPSIKDLVKESLTKVKDAYQIFIEMSDSVRKLLK